MTEKTAFLNSSVIIVLSSKTSLEEQAQKGRLPLSQ